MVGETLSGGGDGWWYEPLHEDKGAGWPVDNAEGDNQAASEERKTGENLEQGGDVSAEVREGDGSTEEGSEQDGFEVREGERSTGKQLKGDVEGNEGGSENQPEKRGTVSTEARLEEAREALAAADEELAKAREVLKNANDEVVRLRDKLNSLEDGIATNVENQSQYESTIMQCETAIRTARSQLIGDLSDMIKCLVVHKEEESGGSLSSITSTLKSITENKERLIEAKKNIAEGKEKKRRLLEQRQNTIGNIAQTQKNLPSLERRVDKLSAQKEKAEARVRHWEKVQEWDIRSEDARREMGGKSFLGFLMKMKRERREVEKELLDKEKELDALDRVFKAGIVHHLQESGLLVTGSEEETWEKLDEIKRSQLEEAKKACKAQLEEIDAKIANVEKYRPTWLNRIQFIYGNTGTKNALDKTKRRVLERPVVDENGDGGASWEQPMPMAA